MVRIILIAVLSMVLAGCGSRKRSLEKTEKQLDYAATADTSAHAVVQNDVAEKNTVQESRAEESKAQSLDVGPGGRATIEEYDAAGTLKKKTTIENNGRAHGNETASAGSRNSVSEKHDRTTTETDASGRHSVKLKAAEKAKAVAVDRKGIGTFWIWVIVLLLVLAALYEWYHTRKRGFL